MNDESTAANERSPEVAEVLERVRAGVLQRRAELATIAEEMQRLPPALARAHELRYVDEPVATSHRPFVGRFIVLAKTFVYKGFMKWYLDSLVRQQNAFNKAASDGLRELFERQSRLASELRRLAETLDDD